MTFGAGFPYVMFMLVQAFAMMHVVVFKDAFMKLLHVEMAEMVMSKVSARDMLMAVLIMSMGVVFMVVIA